MLYPIQQKDLYLYPWFNLFYRFKDDLDRTKTWLAIGYSFNDEFIRNIFIEILDKGGHTLVIVAPEADNIIKGKFGKYKDDQIKKVVGKFGERQTTMDILDKINHI